MNLSRADFENVAVTNAANPSIFGHHYGEYILNIIIYAYIEYIYAGPITNNNAHWDPGARNGKRGILFVYLYYILTISMQLLQL